MAFRTFKLKNNKNFHVINPANICYIEPVDITSDMPVSFADDIPEKVKTNHTRVTYANGDKIIYELNFHEFLDKIDPTNVAPPK